MEKIKLQTVPQIFEAMEKYDALIRFLLDMADNREEEDMIYYIVTDVNDVVLMIKSDIISKFFVAYGERKLAELN